MSTDKPSDETDERQYLLEFWKKSEDVAMHFNQLLIGFRLKAIGGIAIGAAIVIGLKLCDTTSNHLIIGGFFFALAVIWGLIWAADFFYYYRLLAGAVDELLRIERKLGNVFLSHQIEHRVHRNYPAAGATAATELNCLHSQHGPTSHPSWVIKLFYVIPLLLLLVASGIAVFCGEQFSCEKAHITSQSVLN